jgi:hypothetical protein
MVWDSEKEKLFSDALVSDVLQGKIDSAKANIDSDIEGALENFVECLKIASQCMLRKFSSRRKRKSAVWFDVECREAKKKCREKLRLFRQSRDVDNRHEYAQAKKTYRLMIREKKHQFKRSKAASLASNLNNAAVFWKELQSLGSDKSPSISDKIELWEWHDHFKTLFNRSGYENNVNVPESDNSEETAHILNRPITEDEVRKAVSRLKSGKATGTDGIFAEMLKAGGECITSFLTKLFNSIFDKSIYPIEWAKAIIVPIHKKGDLHKADNYRGISLLSIVSKCYTSILNSRLYQWLEDNSKISEEQAGFRRGYSTVDQIFNLYAVAQKCLSKKGQKLYVAFVDFKKAFDSVHHGKLLETIQAEGIKGKFYQALQAMYESLLSCVRVNGVLSEFFDCPVGVRQGCVLSPTLFSLFINQIVSHINESGRHGVQLLPGLLELFILLFADDVALLALTPYGLQNQLNCLKDCCDRLRLEVNIDKTKIMVFRKGGYLTKWEQWFFDGTKLQVVNQYCYLGFMFTTTLSLKQGTQHLVAKGRKAVFSLAKVFQKCKEMSKDTFFTIFDSKVRSIVMYSSEIWGLNRLDSVERVHLMACKRFLCVPTRTPNKLVYGELGRYPLFVTSHIRSVSYWFRLLQLEPNRLPSQAYKMLVTMDENGKKCWVSGIREILSKTGSTLCG